MRQDEAEQDDDENSTSGRQRLDKWLFFARFVRTRALAARFITSSGVRIDGRRVTAAGYHLKTGDVLTLGLPHRTCVVRVLALGHRRGPAQEAALLYETLGDDIEAAGDKPKLAAGTATG